MDGVKHMGLLLLHPKYKIHSPSLIYDLDYTEGRKDKSQTLLYQGLIIKLKHCYKQFAFLYIRQTPSKKETNEIANKFDGIIGDLNLDPAVKNERNN